MDVDYVVTEPERRKLRENRIVLLCGDVDCGSAHEMIEDFQLLLLENTLESIKILISSPGGNVFNGIAMIRAIKQAQKRGIKVIGEVHGHACSMAFFVLQCCDERVMGTLDIAMAHGITTGFVGDMKGMEAENKLLTNWHGEFAAMLASRCKEDSEYGEPSYWFEVLRDNTPQWYTATECLEMGLIDKIDDNS